MIRRLPCNSSTGSASGLAIPNAASDGPIARKTTLLGRIAVDDEAADEHLIARPPPCEWKYSAAVRTTEKAPDDARLLPRRSEARTSLGPAKTEVAGRS